LSLDDLFFDMAAGMGLDPQTMDLSEDHFWRTMAEVFRGLGAMEASRARQRFDSELVKDVSYWVLG